MSRNTKIVLAVLGGLLGVCCLLTVGFFLLVPMVVERVAGDVVVEGSGESSDVGQEIVDYVLPPGYREEGGIQFLGMKMVFIVRDDGGEPFMALMQFPAGIPLNDEEMRQQMQEALGQQGFRQANVEFEVVATEQATINGEPAVLTTMEGTGDQGNQVRQIIGVFEAKDGAGAMVMVVGDMGSWDETAVNQFLASIRDDAGVGR